MHKTEFDELEEEFREFKQQLRRLTLILTLR